MEPQLNTLLKNMEKHLQCFSIKAILGNTAFSAQCFPFMRQKQTLIDIKNQETGNNEMEKMRRRRKKFHKSFVMLGREMLFRCQEWQNLAPSAKILYAYLKAKYNGSNNGHICLHYSELTKIRGFKSHSVIASAFKELEKEGWINRAHKGGLYRYTNEYFLTGKYDGML